MVQSVRGPNAVDVHVGSRLRLRRTLLGMTQTSLGDTIGLTFQQVQKYERGANRIGSSRLYDLSRVLDVPIEYFLETCRRALPPSRPLRCAACPSHPKPSSRTLRPSGKRWSWYAPTTRFPILRSESVRERIECV